MAPADGRKTKKISAFSSLKFWLKRTYANTVGSMLERGNYYILWASDIKSIEGRHGSGVGTYFRFLRFLFFLNLLIGCVMYIPSLQEQEVVL